MKFYLVKEGSDVISRECYSGDDTKIASLVAEKEIANPSKTYEEVSESAFYASSIKEPKEKQDWISEKLKGTDASLSFIAKKLGLE